MFLEILGFPRVIPLWGEFILATIVQFGLGWRFYQGSYEALKSLTGNMDLLIGLGTSAAYFYSAVVFLWGLRGHTYFETSATIITLILLGRWLEARTQKRASEAITALLTLQPKTARVKRGEEWEETPIENIQVGDLYQVRPGEKIPIDGRVTAGSSYVDEAMLTGESSPVHKIEGHIVFSGTQNGNGSLIAQATAVGSDTALAGIIRLVEEAQNSRAPIQNLADKISAIFVPVVVGISLVTFFLWWGLGHDVGNAVINAVAVLVIACPCALGMATPTVIKVASGRGARAGILIKNGEALQRAEKLEVIALDKTGTLTIGRPTVTDIIPDREEVRRLAASLEDLAEHPVALAIATSYPKQKAQVTDFEAIAGKGVMGVIEGQKYFIGSLKWMHDWGIPTDAGITDSLESAGKTVVCLSNKSEALAYIAVADALSPDAKEGVERLKQLGLDVIMLTGDREKTARSIANQVGISTFFAEILPQDKALKIEDLKKNSQVAMVGDGINDAPALAAADVGFAMRGGTDIAREASDITLMHNSISHVADAIDLSKASFRTMRQNLFFAFFYNLLGIPLAAFGLLNPIIAGAAMALSSLCVVINSLLLNRWKPKK